MATSSAAETEAVPMRRRGYEADSTSASSPVPKVVLCERSPPEEPENPDERRKTLSLSGSTGSLFSSLLSSDCGRGAWSSKGVFTCHLCSFVGTSRESFDHHMVDCHYIYRCTECSYSARTQGRLKRHLRDTHSNSSTIASQRGGPARPNSQRPAVGDQLKKSRRQKTIRCKYCKFITVEKNEFWLHLSNHIPADKQLRCNRCPFVTDLKHHHEYHLRGHDGFKPFLCQKCGYSCVNKSMLNSHSKSHSNVYRFRCAVCSFAAKYSHALKLHIVKYGHSAGPVLNQDGSLSVAEGAASPPAFPVLCRERRILVETQISGAFERSLHHQDMKLSAKQMTGLAEIYDVESHPMLVTSALQGERPFVVPKYNFSSPTRSGMSVFPRDGEAISSQVTHGGTVVRHDGNLSISTSSGHALKPELTEATSVSIEYANSPREVLGDYAGHPSAITTTEEYSQHVESPFEVQKKRLLEEGPSLNLPLGSVGANFPSLTTSHFRCTTVSPDGNTADLSSSQHLRQKRIPQSLPLPSDLNESDAIRFCPSMVTTPGKVTTASTNARPFQLANGYSTPTLVPPIDLENGSDHGQPLSLMSSTEESSQSAEIGEFISAGDTRWDNVNIEEPLDLTIRNGITSESRATPTFWDGLCVNELTLAPPYHQMFFQATFSSSSSTSPISYHVEQTVPSYMSQTTSSCHSPPPLLPLSLTLPRSETKGPDRFRLNDNEEMRVPVTASEDPDHSGDEDRWDYCLPSEDQGSFPVELEKVNEESTGGTETDPTFNDREFECRHCRMIFQDYVMFSIHSDHHGYLDPFECNMCGQKCEDRIQFFLHISRVAHD